MDSFTQRMLERAKLRREKLDTHFANDVDMKQDKLQVTNSIGGDSKMAKSPIANDGGAKKVDDKDAKKCQDHIIGRKKKLQKLASLYSGTNNSSLSEEDEEEVHTKIQTSPKKSKCKLSRLAELATKINEWEDDLSHPKHAKSQKLHIISEEATKENEKPSMLDATVLDKLCSQGFSRSESKSKLTYDFQKRKDATLMKSEVDDHRESHNSKNLITKKGDNAQLKSSTPVSNKVAFFETENKKEFKKQIKDPAELPLSERKALFEENIVARNKFMDHCLGSDRPKSSPRDFNRDGFSNVSRIKNLMCNKEKKNATSEKPALHFEKNAFHQRNENVNPRSHSFEKNFVLNKASSVDADDSLGGKHDGGVLNSHDHTVEKKFDSAKEVKNFIPKPPPLPTNVDLAEASASPTGRLYPSLSNLDMTDDDVVVHSALETANESKNSDLCLNVSLTDLLEMNKDNPVTPPSDQSFSKSKECQVLNNMDRLLENALNDLSSETDEDLAENFSSPPKIMKSSSFEYSRSDNQPLLHTVSFYRKQQQTNSIPVEEIEKEPDPVEDESILLENKIQTLIADVNKQQTIMSQASQALNLCLSTVEFSGSGEQVEGERLLLLASHKRQACLNEIQRIKVENSLHPRGENFLSERGDVTLTNISVKLKRDALRAMAAAESLYYFVCLIKSDERVLATPVVSATRENLKDLNLHFPGSIKLEALLSNFRVTVEVYSLELNKELLPHDVKYHISNKKEKKLLTPIKSKKSESKLVKPQIQSPAGPNAVRTSNFRMSGYIVFSLREITRTQWMMNKVPYMSSLEGSLSMTIHSQLRLDDEFRGFLTMFDDISGFGAWHRRWCLLSSHVISFWKYPDDEQKKVPIGTIDLRCVVTENVNVVSYDICARLHTFLLETTRPKLSEDKDSLVLRVRDNVTTIRHLISADSKQEMLTWCKKLNTILALLRSWKCNFDG